MRNCWMLAAVAVAALGASTGSSYAQQTIRVGWTIPAEESKYWMMRRPAEFPATATGRRDFDPALAAAERDVGAQLEAELLRVERDRLVLVLHRDHHGADLRDLRRSLRVAHLKSSISWVLLLRRSDMQNLIARQTTRSLGSAP